MQISKRVITQLEKSDWFDRILLLFGLLLFCSVVLYIIKKRTWDVGISWVSWLSQTKKSKQQAVLDAVTKTIVVEPSTILIDTISSATASILSTATTSIVSETTITSAATVIASVIKDEL